MRRLGLQEPFYAYLKFSHPCPTNVINGTKCVLLQLTTAIDEEKDIHRNFCMLLGPDEGSGNVNEVYEKFKNFTREIKGKEEKIVHYCSSLFQLGDINFFYFDAGYTWSTFKIILENKTCIEFPLITFGGLEHFLCLSPSKEIAESLVKKLKKEGYKVESHLESALTSQGKDLSLKFNIIPHLIDFNPTLNPKKFLTNTEYKLIEDARERNWPFDLNVKDFAEIWGKTFGIEKDHKGEKFSKNHWKPIQHKAIEQFIYFHQNYIEKNEIFQEIMKTIKGPESVSIQSPK